jgi:alpha-tubulin suppressor-like RCC1 family protein
MGGLPLSPLRLCGTALVVGSTACSLLVGLEGGQVLLPPEQDDAEASAGTDAGAGDASACVGCDETVVQSGAGRGFTCVLYRDGRVACWGLARMGQLGVSPASLADRTNDGLVTRYATRVVAGLPPARRVATGFEFACIVAAAGDVHCWGLNDKGQLGHGSGLDELCTRAPTTSTRLPCNPTPVRVDGLPSLDPVEDIVTGDDFACALTRSGALYCWGNNVYGAVGTPPGGSLAFPRRAALPEGVRVVQVAAALNGNNVYARLEDGRVFAWGDNRSGQLGHASGSSGDMPRCTDAACNPVPQPVPSTSGGPLVADEITAGQWYACARVGQSVLCWGDNLGGCLGFEADALDHPVPRVVPGLPPIAAVKAAYLTSYGIDVEGRLWGWGSNGLGELALGNRLGEPDGGACGASVTCRWTPARIPLPDRVRELTTGYVFNVARTDDGAMLGWGHVTWGELGRNPLTVAGVEPCGNMAFCLTSATPLDGLRGAVGR